MARKDESILNLVSRLPWKFGVFWAAVVFFVSQYIVPRLVFKNPLLKGLSLSAPKLGIGFALAILAAAAVSAINGWRRSRMLGAQDGIKSLKRLNWREFEELMGEAFRRQGYFVLENPSRGPDGGVDLRMRKDGKTVYVQCKHWKTWKVEVGIVRELYGVMTENGTDEGIVVSIGQFTPEAKRFAHDKPIELIDGPQLLRMIQSLQKKLKVTTQEPTRKTCPVCGSELVIRTAKRGLHTGQQFWGCSKFPKCRGTLNYLEEGG
jgi:restriction system protein